MGKKEENRGRRRAPKPQDHSAFKDFRQSKLIAIPIFIVIASLIVVPAASNWIPQDNNEVPVISAAPTLTVTEPSIAPTILPVPTLTFATFNIAKPNNTSVPAWKNRREAIGRTINESNSDVIGLQETKVNDPDFPLEVIEEIGYHPEYWGQKGHYGVAFLSKKKPIKTIKGFKKDTAEDQKRFIECTFSTGKSEITIMNGYFPQGENINHESKFPKKIKYYDDLELHIKKLKKTKESYEKIRNDTNRC